MFNEAPQQRKQPPLHVEIIQDLAKLVTEFPNGFDIASLQDWYGERHKKVEDALQECVNRDYIRKYTRINKKSVYFPTFQKLPEYWQLSNFQRSLVKVIQQQSSYIPNRQLTTNYSQLARLINRSYGGTTICMRQLIEEGFIIEHQKSLRGRQQQLVISLVPISQVSPSPPDQPQL